ncbi:MAG TPA: sigma factor-like helix-turn-helix DNA-binding protein, partial [Burkholderiales bacterium]|nr:sigma factor-like helix-turn-helix DNA-binding protein [Burkholderiales bacterium]
AFLLQQESDMSIEEIAQATGVSRETAKSRLRYAIAKLREGMQHQDREYERTTGQ